MSEKILFDIIFVTYNSEKHIEYCFKALQNIDYSLDKINVVVVDNNSSDRTIELLEKVKKEFPNFHIIQSGANLGFGLGCNLGAENSKAPYVFFLNVDTEIEPDALTLMEKKINESDSNVGAWEMRQMPYEHPKYYNPLTGDTSWCSGACVVIKRSAFEEVKGFDKHIFMYAEDVDISWNLRKHGYRLLYVPEATITHYAYSEAGEIKPVQYYNSILNNLLLRLKYGTFKQNIKGTFKLWSLFLYKGPFKHSRWILLKEYLKRFPKYFAMFLRRIFGKRNKGFKPTFVGWDYERIRAGAFYEVKRIHEGPLVSIIIRTCGRPKILREAIQSVVQQTYRNYEIIVIEDGVNASEALIKENFQNEPIHYFSTGENVGRCKVANIGLEKAQGKFCNFLDDDDLLFADHLETLIAEYQKQMNRKILYSYAFECKTEYTSESYESYIERDYIRFEEIPFSRLMLFRRNYIPIQTVLFSRSLLEKTGGFDEELEYLEDWDFWIRCALETKFHLVEKTTSLFRTPFVSEVREERQKALNDCIELIDQRYNDRIFSMTVGEGKDESTNLTGAQSVNSFLGKLKNKLPWIYKPLNWVWRKVK